MSFYLHRFQHIGLHFKFKNTFKVNNNTNYILSDKRMKLENINRAVNLSFPFHISLIMLNSCCIFKTMVSLSNKTQLLYLANYYLFIFIHF